MELGPGIESQFIWVRLMQSKGPAAVKSVKMLWILKQGVCLRLMVEPGHAP